VKLKITFKERRHSDVKMIKWCEWLNN